VKFRVPIQSTGTEYLVVVIESLCKEDLAKEIHYSAEMN